MLFDESQLDQQFELFKQFIRLNSGEAFQDFTHPYYQYREAYMRDVYYRALNSLKFTDWKDEDIGSGKILRDLIAASEVKGNNLFLIDDRYGPESRKHQIFYDGLQNLNLGRKIELLYFNFYNNVISDEEFFYEIAKIEGADYRFICFWLFIKNNKIYNPIAQDGFNKINKLIGCPVQLTYKKEWQAYLTINLMIQQVSGWLKEKTGIEVDIFDAHGFLWFLTYDEFPDKLDPKIDRYYKLSNTPKSSKLWNLEPDSDSQLNIQNKRSEKDKYKSSEDFLREYLRRQAIGLASEELAIAFEQKRLNEANRPDLIKRMNTDCRYDPSKGFDLLSHEIQNDAPRLIEVKTVRKKGSDFYSFFISLNELDKAINSGNYWFYTVENPESEKPVISSIKSDKLFDKEIHGRFLKQERLTTTTLDPLQFLVTFSALQLE